MKATDGESESEMEEPPIKTRKLEGAAKYPTS